MKFNEVATSGRDLHAVCAVLRKKIVMGAARSTARVFKNPPVVNWKDTDGTIPRDRNTVVMPTIATALIRISTGPSIPQIKIRNQEIEGPRRSIIHQEDRNSESLDTFINRISSQHRDPTPIWS